MAYPGWIKQCSDLKVQYQPEENGSTIGAHSQVHQPVLVHIHPPVDVLAKVAQARGQVSRRYPLDRSSEGEDRITLNVRSSCPMRLEEKACFHDNSVILVAMLELRWLPCR